MALYNPKKLPVSSALCYKDQLVVSLTGDNTLQLLSLGGYPYPFIASSILDSHAKSLECGVKNDVVLAATGFTVFILKIENKTLFIVDKKTLNADLVAFSFNNDFFTTGNTQGQVKI